MLFYAIRQIFLKGGTIKDAIYHVFKMTGKMPTKSEGKKIINVYQDVQKNTGKVLEFPKDRITPFYKPRPGEGGKLTKDKIFKIDDELEKLSAKEGKYSKMNRNDREDLMIKLQDESSTLQEGSSKFNDEFRSFKLNIAKNNPEFNQDLAKQVINREMFKDATTEQRKQVLDALESVLKNPEGLASGGMAREKFGRGYLAGGAKSLGKKYKGSTLQALLENPKLLGAELGHDGIASILSLFGFSEGGRARVGMFLGGPIVPIVKGGKWFLKALRDTRKLMTQNKQHSPEQLKYYLNQIDDQIKNIEAGGKIPDEVIQTIRSDSKFKSLSQTKANDPDLREIEEVLLEYGEKHASGGIAGQLHLNQGGRVSFTKGGKVSSGLANILGV